MSTEAQNTAEDASALPKPSEPLPAAEPETGADLPPMGQDVIDTWAEAADETGTVRSTKQMPEPDSRGG
jgi:hypothetical protein